MAEVDFGRVFEALPSPFMIIDRELRYVAANAAYLETTGSTLDQLMGQPLFDLFPNPGESGRRLRESFQRVLATGESDTLAYIPYPIPNREGGFTNRYWTAIHVPIMGDDGRPEFVMQNTVDVTDFVRLREASSLPFTSLAAETSLIERTREAEESSQAFRQLFQRAPAFFAVLSGPSHIFTFASDSYVRLVGERNVVGRPVAEALPEVVGQGFVRLLDRVYNEGYVHTGESARLMLVRKPGGEPEETYLDFSYNPIRDAEDRITGVFVQGMDRTEAVRAAQRQRLLIDELNHRVKNTLATVQSIASQTLRSTSDPGAARQAFESRIIALSKAHTILSERQWHDTEIGQVIAQEIGAFDVGQVEYGGPILMVNAKTTVALALVIHELATNAAKHGALSTAEGRLLVNWRLEGDRLVIHWTESGGPAVATPARRGFGSRLLQTVVTGELGGALETNYAAEGFSARLCIPHESYRVQEQVGV